MQGQWTTLLCCDAEAKQQCTNKGCEEEDA